MSEAHPLRQWRKSKSMDQAEFGKLVGVAASHISQIETGVKAPSLALAVRIEAETGIPPSKIVSFADGAQA